MEKTYKTIVLSDIHLGSKWSKAKEVTNFIKNNSCETLILCGDIIDGWEIIHGKKKKWKRKHTNFIKAILDLSDTTKVVYIRGNHDDFLNRLTPLNYMNISIVNDYIYSSFGKDYYILHGDVFDNVTSSMKWLAKLGDIGYTSLLWLNNKYNKKRLKKGLPYYSLSQEIKQKVKKSVAYISDFENHLVDIANEKSCDAVICGHIHHPEIKTINNITYLNAGDWVESLSALTEDFNGVWQLYQYSNNNDSII